MLHLMNSNVVANGNRTELPAMSSELPHVCSDPGEEHSTHVFRKAALQGLCLPLQVASCAWLWVEHASMG